MSEQRPDRSTNSPGGGGNGGGPGGNKKNGAGNGGPAGRGPVGAGRMPFGRGFFGWLLFICLGIMLFLLVNKTSTSYATIPLSEFTYRLENDLVKNLTIDG